jgi:D-3-phosphoglycerate dehydrogenase / 2-oxoglutarate reductase
VTRVLVTCPPMLARPDDFLRRLEAAGVEAVCPEVVQTLSEEALLGLVPDVDGWVVGDDPATARVLEAGAAGRLRAVVKWGIGVDNVDGAACERLGLPFTNTPGVFGREVADLAMAYLVALSRGMVAVDRGVRAGGWPKPTGISLAGRTVALVGHGDVGGQLRRRLRAADVHVLVYDPAVEVLEDEGAELRRWPDGLEQVSAVLLTCPLTPATHHLLDAAALAACPPGVLVVNVGRGPVVDQAALEDALARGHVGGAALDVYEVEPLPAGSPLRDRDDVVLGSHNASHTAEAVARTTARALDALLGALGVAEPDGDGR